MDNSIRFITFFVAVALTAIPAYSSNWSEWWTYGGVGISGPKYWGKINPAWKLCSRGKYQSPVNINPDKIIHDPNLSALKLSGKAVDGKLINSGRDIYFLLDKATTNRLYFTGGPLTYTYQIDYITIHYGRKNTVGSEHSVDGQFFPMELQMVGFNSDLFGNIQSALSSSFGVATLSVLVQIARKTDGELQRLLTALNHTRFKGERFDVEKLNVDKLLPDVTYYITYEGSMTQPGCEEVVTWIILNKPLHISPSDMKHMRKIYRSEKQEGQYLLKETFRPTSSLNFRTIRTNLPHSTESTKCKSRLHVQYTVNAKFKK